MTVAGHNEIKQNNPTEFDESVGTGTRAQGQAVDLMPMLMSVQPPNRKVDHISGIGQISL